jgi:hypothetical protein
VVELVKQMVSEYQSLDPAYSIESKEPILKVKKHAYIAGSETEPAQNSQQNLDSRFHSVVRRRSFLKGLGAAGVALPASRLFAADKGVKLGPGDAALLRFAAAAELIEADLWQQYNELGGLNGGNASYKLALENLDGDMPQYIADNTDDEVSHAAFINAYLISKGAQPVDLDVFRTLPSSQATGALPTGRLTNLMQLNVDTSWYTRYRSTHNPDFDATFPQAVNISNQPAIPLNDADTPPGTLQPIPPVTRAARRMQAIANTAGFHFAYIEQGGASLYPILALKASGEEVLRILLSIGGVEIDHFGLWHDKAGNGVSQPLAGVVDPETGVTFPDLNNPPFGGELLQTNLILPEPCEFISPNLPACSVIRPTLTRNGGAVATINSFTDDLLFLGQSAQFFDTVMALAAAADSVQRQG